MGQESGVAARRAAAGRAAVGPLDSRRIEADLASDTGYMEEVWRY